MADSVFVDTNVLVYSRDASEPHKQELAMVWMDHLWRTRSGRLSFQVLQEFYITVTDKLDPGLDHDSARKDINAFLAWHPVSVNARVFDGAWHLQDRYGISWWDALIVAGAQIADCSYLLTEDLQEEQVFGNLQVVNPFHTDPESLKL